MLNQQKFYNFLKKHQNNYFIFFSLNIPVNKEDFFNFFSKILNLDLKYLKKLLLLKKVFLNFKVIKNFQNLKKKDHLLFVFESLEERIFIKEQYQKIFFVEKNSEYFLLFKPSGITCQKSYHHFEYTIVDFLKEKIKNIFYLDDFFYGILHRLDKVTSGLILGNITKEAYFYFKNLFKEQKIEKKYLALIHGVLSPKNLKVNLPLEAQKSNYLVKKVSPTGQNALTFLKTLKVFQNNKYSLIEAKIITGKTHQIRAHLSYLKHPILYDFKYQSSLKNLYILLHAYYLKFYCFKEKKEKIFFLEMPKYFYQKIKEVS
ncbi:RNA pseudouridine synthase [symbiont of Argiope bruennichi]|uniref:RluA family pseudouridine synthase n=1 Tax=symbiont of Argiope bruennichi TaxID=2810479 RepID=UPI003DA587E2